MDIVEKLERDKPAFHWGGARRWNAAPQTLREIRDGVREGMRTMETGCGASTVVFAASGAQHTVVSPTSDEHARVRDYLAANRIDDSLVRFEPGFSDDLLPQLYSNPDRIKQWEAWYDRNLSAPEEAAHEGLFTPSTERFLDWVFLDGAHSFPYPVIDWHYSMNVLKIGGRMLVDDVPIPAVACVYQYMVSDPSWRLVDVHDERAVSFELASEPAAEDWTLQPYNREPFLSFLPLRRQVLTRSEGQFGKLRHELGERMPGLRRTWQRWSG